MRKLLAIITFVLFVSYNAWGQGWVVQENTFETNWNITLQVGRTALLSEVHTDFSGSSNDMNNLSDWGFNLQIGKMVWERFDMGVEFGFSNYKGYRKNSSNVNYLMLHHLFNNELQDFQPYAIYYDSDIINCTVYAKYNFINFNTWATSFMRLNMYVKLGIGIAFPSSELGYTDKASYELTGLTHPLYVKGRYPNYQRDAHNFFHPAFGMNYQLSDRIFLSGEVSFQFIGADNIDGIHNFNQYLTPDVPDHLTREYRIRVYDLTAKFMFGVSYFFNFDSHRKNREKYLPFFSNRYRSYYSKYHNTSTKKDRQERLPFFNDKLKE